MDQEKEEETKKLYCVEFVVQEKEFLEWTKMKKKAGKERTKN